MKATIRIVLGLLMIGLFLAGCKSKTPTATVLPPTSLPPTSPPPTDTLPPPPTETLPPTEALTQPPTEPAKPTDEPVSLEEQRIEFEAEDGVSLVGSYFPARFSPAPTVILMHQAGSDRRAWEQAGLVAWLQNRGNGGGGALFAPSLGASLWPSMPGSLSFAVFTFDFREHGESGGAFESGSDFLVDAKAALQRVKEFPGVDPERIVMIGASIGADAAVDACVEGCLGGLSLSPGSYLDVDYAEVVAEMTLDGKPAWCLASEDDHYSADTCKSASGDAYRSIIYAAGGHGESLLIPGLDPDIGQVFLDFLLLAFGISA